MQLVILAAGRGTRMKSLTDIRPKPMIPLLGKPKLQYTLESLPKEIEEVILVINYLGQQIQDYFGNNFQGRKISYVFQKELKGTGAAVHECKDHLKDDFVVLMGDDLYLTKDIEKVLKHPLAILACQVDNPEQFGIFILDEKGNFSTIKERPHNCETNLVNTGLYKLNKKFFDYPLMPVYDGTEFGLPQTLGVMARDFPVIIEKTKFWKPLGKVEDIAVAEQALKKLLSIN